MYLSIIVPFFNAESYIGDCIDTLLNQGLEQGRYELILINDGSTDGSRRIVEGYCSDHKDLVFVDDINRGVYVQRNKGLELARGQYIFFMDADDYLVNNCLNQLLQYAIDNQLELLGFNAEATNNRNEHHAPSPLVQPLNLQITSGMDYLVSYPNTRLEIWWYLINREFLGSLDLSFYEGYYHADAPFTMELWSRAQRVAFCPESLHRYYQSENSIMRGPTGKGFLKRYDSSLVMFSKIKNIIKTVEASDQPRSKEVMHILRMRTDQHALFFIIGIFRSSLPKEELTRAVRSMIISKAYPMKAYLREHIDDRRGKTLIQIFNRPQMLKMAFTMYRTARRLKFT